MQHDNQRGNLSPKAHQGYRTHGRTPYQALLDGVKAMPEIEDSDSVGTEVNPDVEDPDSVGTA